MPKVSIIVPVYGVEKYLVQALDSLVNQTLKDIEIIIVNDCSPDNSHSIILNYIHDNRIKYIVNDENKGELFSRKRALENVTGDFVINFDSDDYIELNYYEELYNFAICNGLGIAVSNINIVSEDGTLIKKSLKPLKKLIKKPSDFRILLGTEYGSWSRLIKRELVEKYVQFPMYGVDASELNVFALQFFDDVSVGINSYVHYNYRQRDGSLSTYKKASSKKSINNIFDEHRLTEIINDYACYPINSDVKREILGIYLFRAYYFLFLLVWSYEEPNKKYRRNIYKKMMKNLKFSFKNLIKYSLDFKLKSIIFLILVKLRFEFLIYKWIKKGM